MDRAKLAGVLFSAMLLAAVTEAGEETGNARAGEEVFWGQAVIGLQAGLSAKQAKFDVGQPIELLIHVKNVAGRRLVLLGADSPVSTAWKCVFNLKSDQAGGMAYVPQYQIVSSNPPDDPAGDVTLVAGESRRLQQTYEERTWSWLNKMPGHRTEGALPAGTYLVTAGLSVPNDRGQGDDHWSGKVSTGSVEIEIVRPLQKIEKCLALVKNKSLAETDRARVVRAIRELGTMRATEAMAELAEKLDFHVSKDGILKSEEIPGLEDVYPAVEALIKIGEPAVAAIADAVAARERSGIFLGNAAYTVMKIAGGNEQARIALTALALKQAKASPGRTRLKNWVTLIPIVIDKDPKAVTPRLETPRELLD